MKVKHLIAFGISIACTAATFATAQDITFKFTNPSFGGNPFNSGHLLGLAEIQQQHEEPRQERVVESPQSRAQANFLRRLESRLFDQAADDIFEFIDAGEIGERMFRAGDQDITVTITDTGQTTVRTESRTDPSVFTVVVLNADLVDGMQTTN